ncbi:hypothetical protein ACLB2K_041364 [Fragaria x ananassa]
MQAKIRWYQDDKIIMKQYAENDRVVENGRVIKTQSEVVPALSHNHQPIIWPLIRLQEKNIILTRINPQRSTSGECCSSLLLTILLKLKQIMPSLSYVLQEMLPAASEVEVLGAIRQRLVSSGGRDEPMKSEPGCSKVENSMPSDRILQENQGLPKEAFHRDDPFNQVMSCYHSFSVMAAILDAHVL